MSIFLIKIMACITMVFDHIKYGVPSMNNFITRYLGRISFPLFAFVITEGFDHTKNLNKYYKRLLIFAIISQIPFMLFRTLVGGNIKLNILFTFLFGLMAISFYKNIEDKYLSIPIIIIDIILGNALKVDYGWYGITTVFIFYVFKNNKINLSIAFFILNIFYFYTRKMLYLKLNVIMNFLFIMSSLIFVFLYNGRKGKSFKYFFYWFYPVHMIILFLINKYSIFINLFSKY